MTTDPQFVCTLRTRFTPETLGNMSEHDRLTLLASYDRLVAVRWAPHPVTIDAVGFTTPDVAANIDAHLFVQWIVDLPPDHPAWAEWNRDTL